MKQAGRKAGQQRDAAQAAVPVSESVVSVPWRPRADGLQAILVNPRTTVFDRPMIPPTVVVDQVEDIADPIWNDQGGKVWTPDLVHCRLLNVGDTISCLPSPYRRGFVSLLADVALDERDREIRRTPAPAEVTIADWTWSQLLKRPDRQRAILQAMAFGASVRSVARMLERRSADKVAKTSVSRWYLAERRQLAAIWVREKQAVDQATFDRWRGLFDKGQN